MWSVIGTFEEKGTKGYKPGPIRDIAWTDSGLHLAQNGEGSSCCIFTSQVIALLPLYNALTTYEAQTGEMQINRLDQPP